MKGSLLNFCQFLKDPLLPPAAVFQIRKGITFHDVTSDVTSWGKSGTGRGGTGRGLGFVGFIR